MNFNFIKNNFNINEFINDSFENLKAMAKEKNIKIVFIN